MKIPAEKNFIVHLLWLKNKLENGVIKQLIWTDTRAMTADGHTKGSIKRTAIHHLMNGSLTVQCKRESLTLYNPRAQLTQPKSDRVEELSAPTLAVHVVDFFFAMSHAASSGRPGPSEAPAADDYSSGEAPAVTSAKLANSDNPCNTMGGK